MLYEVITLDHVLLVRVASTAVVTRMLGGGQLLRVDHVEPQPENRAVGSSVITSYSIHYTKLYEVDGRSRR